jgi:radical SAM-linked protein
VHDRSGTTSGETLHATGEVEAAAELPSEPLSSPPRQRWRLVVARSGDAPRQAGRELTDAWDAALEASGLPVVRAAGRSRWRVAFGAPLPVEIAAERELVDIVLTELLPAWEVREALTGRLPEGWRLVEIHDVWLGAPSLASQVAAADYRIDLGDCDGAAITAAAAGLLSAATLPRERPKGGTTVRYDLRPLLIDLSVADPGPPVLLRARTRIDPVLGTGRPEEVLAALAEEAGTPLTAATMVRERLILASDLT